MRDVTAVAHPGQTVAIVGPNGAGKSTLLALIGRLADLDCGSVLLDGSNLAHVRLAESRAVIGMAGPDLPLMSGSLRRNLTYHHRDATPTAINAVIDLWGLRELLENLDDGFDTRIDEGGTNLSSGQRQRILLARAVLARPRLLLLDEADANLDAATTGILDTVLAQHEGSALIVTHRIDRVRAADEVWHLADGRLVETGPPAEVLTPGHHTARLFHIEATPDRAPFQPGPDPGSTWTEPCEYVGQHSR